MQKSPPECTPITLLIKEHPKLSNLGHIKPRDNPRQAWTKPTIQHPNRSHFSPPRLKKQRVGEGKTSETNLAQEHIYAPIPYDKLLPNLGRSIPPTTPR